jgi:WD40 repeat protein
MYIHRIKDIFIKVLLNILIITLPIYSQSYKLLTGHKGNVNSAAFSPDSKVIASGDENGNLIFRESETFSKIHSLEIKDNITSVNYSTSELNLFVYTTYEGEAVILKADTKEIIKNIKKDGNIYYAVFSPDGKMLAISYTKEASEKDRSRGIRLNFITDIHDTKKFEKFRTLRISKPNDSDGELFGSNLFETYRFNAFNCDFTPSSKYIASGTMGKGIAIYSFEYKKFVPEYKGHSKRVTFVNFSPDGNYLASASKDDNIRLWDIESANKIITLKGHNKTVNSLSFSPDSKYLASGSNDETVKIWDVKTSKLIRTIGNINDEVYCVKFSTDGKFLISSCSGGKLLVWNFEDIISK